MIERRDVAKCIILSLVTCGIYGIFWFIKMTDDSNQVGTTQTASGGMAFLFTLITCGIYGWYWAYKLGQKIDEAKGTDGNSGILYVILNICGLGIVTYALAQSELNNFAQ
ncbi:MAG: DUF4234 domain-containing protein [Lachnospiraceae bacterium]|nr:DUF4234 domain-containing protein [Lachnospiraceae bacterium]